MKKIEKDCTYGFWKLVNLAFIKVHFCCLSQSLVSFKYGGVIVKNEKTLQGKFDIMLGRHICLKRSCDLAPHTQGISQVL